MYYLMNKDEAIMCFEAFESEGAAKDFEPIDCYSNGTPIGFQGISAWIEDRKALKHNAHIKSIMTSLGCADDEGYIRLTQAASINDTFWIKEDGENVNWNNISLYRNQFSEVISKLAFNGAGLGINAQFSTTSPEFSCEGSFRKCFIKEKNTGVYGSDIFIYKRGGDIGKGLEPYCEALASEIACHISRAAVPYELVTHHNKLATKCNLFTNEDYGYASFSKIQLEQYTVDQFGALQRKEYKNPFEFFYKMGFEQAYREMLVIDSLCFNEDRHEGNFGVLFSNDTLDIISMAPVFDLNYSLFYNAENEVFLHTVSQTDPAVGDMIFNRYPKLEEDFTQMGRDMMNGIIRDKVKDMKDFCFAFRGDDVFPESRVKGIEEIVRKQAAAILSQDKLYTKDVFSSQKAIDEEKEKKQYERLLAKVEDAKKLLSEFMDIADGIPKGDEIFTSHSVSTEAVEFYIEKLPSYEITIDFLNGKCSIRNDAHSIDRNELSRKDKELWEYFKLVKSIFDEVTKDKNMPINSHGTDD